MTAPASADSGALLRDVLARIGDKWSVIVICRLDGRPRRFNELRRLAEGITQRMLSATLRHLERDGLVRRTVYATVPPQVEYALTERGRTLHTILYQLVDWTDGNLAGIQASRAAYDARGGRAAQADDAAGRDALRPSARAGKPTVVRWAPASPGK